jgi:hypothetical protein
MAASSPQVMFEYVAVVTLHPTSSTSDVPEPKMTYRYVEEKRGRGGGGGRRRRRRSTGGEGREEEEEERREKREETQMCTRETGGFTRTGLDCKEQKAIA